jgi:putative endopeptidase
MGDSTHPKPSDAAGVAFKGSIGLDFYTYINRNWQAKAYIEPYESTFSVSDEIEDRVEAQLFTIVKRIQDKHPHAPLSQLVRSIMNPAFQTMNMASMRHVLNLMDCMSSAESVGAMIGRLNRIQANSPLAFVVANDRYTVNKRCVYIYEPKLGLPEKHFYRQGDHNSRDTASILLAYTNLLKKVGAHFQMPDLESVVALEGELVKYLSPENDRENVAFSYRSQSLRELEQDYPQIPWRSMVDHWGVPKELAGHATFILTNRRYIAHLNHLFRTLSMETWRTWMRAQVLLQYLKYLPAPLDSLYFQLFGADLQGTQEKLPLKFLMMKILKEHCPQSLGKVYVHYAVSHKLKSTANQLVRRLRAATLKRIAGLSWMSGPTKQKAAEKCKAMLFQIAYPDTWKPELDHVAMTDDHMLQNIWNLSKYDTDRMIEDLPRGPINEKDNWDDGVFEVNAYYYSDKNMMVVPAGILNAPFFDMERSDAWNLGGIGAAIGHEITHGFDDDGRMYDKSGVMKNWWSDKDVETYTHVTKALVHLFNSATYMGGKVNGQLTLSENIADLGGVAIALEALQETLRGLNMNRKKALQEFFTSYAVSWRNKDRPKKARQSLILDRHAPAPIRVNLIVRQFAEFYEAFDIGEQDPGYIPPAERIQLW